MKKICLLKQKFFSEARPETIFKFARMTLLLIIVTAFLSGTFNYAYGSLKTEGINSGAVLSSDKADNNGAADLQQSKLSGTITDEKGSPFPGVNITVEGTTIGTMSDVNGKYSLAIPGGSAAVIFTFVGYSTQRIAVEGKNTIDVVMMPDVMNLDEVVVVGYGTTRRATITGAVASVAGDKLQVSKSTNFSNTLVGRLPGLVANQRSGLPGADDATLRIRGNNTLNNNNPLIVVDGIANRSMSRINPADVESVIVLKDASAAIYGAQAANGVILITTKRGASGKLKVNVDFNQGFSSPTVLPGMADSYLYATMMNEVDTYAGQTPRFSADDLQKYQRRI